jgi:hypothetical protein
MSSRGRTHALLLGGAVLFGLLVTGGCGHKGTPKPPPQKIPERVRDLKVTQRGNQMLVSFSYPQVTISGLPIEDIVSIELWEYAMPVPDFRAEVLGAEEGEGTEGEEAEGEEDAAEDSEGVAAGEGEDEEDGAGEGEAETQGDTEEAEPEEADADERSSRGAEPLAGPQGTGSAARTGVVSDFGELEKLGEIGTTIESAITEGAGAPDELEPGEDDEDDDDDDDDDSDDDGEPSVSKESLLEVDPRQFAVAARRRATLAGAELSNAISGSLVRTTIDLGEVEPSELEAMVYAVKSFQTLKRASGFSNVVTIIPRVTPDPPTELEASATSDGIRLAWVFEGEEPEEFRIYRRDPLQPSFDLHIGVREGDEDRFLDSGAAFGGEYIYVVTAVINKVPLVESRFSEELEVGLVDEFAPEPPTDLVIFAEVGTARLLWQASEDDDLDGYFIYRKEADGPFERLNDEPHRRTDYNDTEAASGRRYSYRIVAVDLTGNTSEPSEEVETRIP